MACDALQYLRQRNADLRAKDDAILAAQAERDAEAAKLTEEMDAKPAGELLEGLDLNYAAPFVKSIVAARDDLCHLPADRLFDVPAIRQTCESYGLVFKPSSCYQGKLSKEIPLELKEFRRLNLGTIPTFKVKLGGRTSTFWIMAHPRCFTSPRYGGAAFLFCAVPVGTSDYSFYLVHRWGRAYGFKHHALSWLSRLRGIPTFTLIALITYAVLTRFTEQEDRAGSAAISVMVLLLAGAIIHANKPRYNPFVRAIDWTDSTPDY